MSPGRDWQQRKEIQDNNLLQVWVEAISTMKIRV